MITAKYMLHNTIIFSDTTSVSFGYNYILEYNTYIQSVTRLVDLTAGGDFLGLCDKKKVHINTCPILDGYRVMGIFLIPVHVVV